MEKLNGWYTEVSLYIMLIYNKFTSAYENLKPKGEGYYHEGWSPQNINKMANKGR